MLILVGKVVTVEEFQAVKTGEVYKNFGVAGEGQYNIFAVSAKRAEDIVEGLNVQVQVKLTEKGTLWHKEHKIMK